MRRFRDILTFIALGPIWLPLLLIVGLTLSVMCIPVSIQGYFLHRRWKQKLVSAGRVSDATTLSDATSSGTLIIDRPAMGWNTTYCWWTPVDIANEAPIPIPTDDDRKQFIADSKSLEHPFDRWCYDTFLSVNTGTAILVSTRHGERVARRLQNIVPGARLVYTWSAPFVDVEFNGNRDKLT